MLDAYGINAGDGLTGKHYSTFVQVTDPITHVGKDDFYNNDYAAFFEDNWKATSKLTINMGLRYDLSTIPQPPQPNTLTPLTTLYTSTIHVPKDEFAPRLGVAWQASKNTVLRAGYGLFFAKTTNTTYYATRVENGVFQQTFNCTPTSCPALSAPNLIFTPPGPPLAAPFAGALTPQVTNFTPPAATQASRGQSPDWVNPRVHEGDITLERQLPGGISGSVAYVVSRGEHLPIFVDANLAPSTTTKSYDILSASGATTQTYTVPFYTSRIDTGTGEIFVGYSDVNSWYNSMVITRAAPHAARPGIHRQLHAQQSLRWRPGHWQQRHLQRQRRFARPQESQGGICAERSGSAAPVRGERHLDADARRTSGASRLR